MGAAAAAPLRGAGEPAEPPGRRQVALGHNRLPGHVGAPLLSLPLSPRPRHPLKPGRREPLAPVGAFSLAFFPRLSPLLPALGRAARCAYGGRPCAPAPHGGRSNGPWGSARPVLWPAIGPLPRAGSNLVRTQSCVQLCGAPRALPIPLPCPLPLSRPPPPSAPPPPPEQPRPEIEQGASTCLLDHSLV